MAEDGDGEFAFDLNEPPLEHGNGTFLLCLTGFFFSRACLYSNCAISLLLYRFSYHCFPFFLTGFDLNLPLNEFGAVDFDYVQHLAGKPTCFLIQLDFARTCHGYLYYQ